MVQIKQLVEAAYSPSLALYAFFFSAPLECFLLQDLV
jgi:hypothetical protein